MSYGIIYKIENKINGKIYIGQTVKSFDERYGGDIEKNTHNKHLRNSIKKYGIENFVIDKCVCKCETKEELDRVEQFYIYVYDAMDPEHGYNKREGGNGGKLSNETKQKMSEAQKGEKHPMWGKNPEDYMTEETIKIKREKQSKALKGKPFSNEHKKKLSENHANVSGKKNPMYGKNSEDYMTEEAIQMRRKKISKAFKGEKNPRARAVIQLSNNGDFIKKYDFIKQAAKELNINRQSISACCKGKIKSAGGYMWKYLDEFISSTTGDTPVSFLK